MNVNSNLSAAFGAHGWAPPAAGAVSRAPLEPRGEADRYVKPRRLVLFSPGAHVAAPYSGELLRGSQTVTPIQLKPTHRETYAETPAGRNMNPVPYMNPLAPAARPAGLAAAMPVAYRATHMAFGRPSAPANPAGRGRSEGSLLPARLSTALVTQGRDPTPNDMATAYQVPVILSGLAPANHRVTPHIERLVDPAILAPLRDNPYVLRTDPARW